MTNKKKPAKIRRLTRVRSKIRGTAVTPRLTVAKSNANLFAQLIDDVKGITLAGVSTIKMTGTKTEKAKTLGEAIAEKAKSLKITSAVFDRGYNRYHGRIRSLADSAREKGLKI